MSRIIVISRHPTSCGKKYDCCLLVFKFKGIENYWAKEWLVKFAFVATIWNFQDYTNEKFPSNKKWSSSCPFFFWPKVECFWQRGSLFAVKLYSNYQQNLSTILSKNIWFKWMATGVLLGAVDQICIWIESFPHPLKGDTNRVLINDWRHNIILHHNKTKVDKEGTSRLHKKFAILGRRLE